MTNVTLAVRRQSHGNRNRYAAIKLAIVAALATSLRPRRPIHVLHMIKLHVEALFEIHGKRPHGWSLAADIGMTDGAHWAAGANKLPEVTAGASLMSRKNWRSGVIA